ncbi:TetR/AcrR family transcriptional regulator [Kineococcus indalonis]|uniref:TetR/AcrR family transcriptional regulator n=1 Tax=Kineococcus indalonis TaxID=2696566 RepID=UPI0014120DAA|nr:TetR/AcrR family transcriptional regulator [Kineococcus indalonis]NAZ88087.1 TetR family transcriptional regulator [Kineococcus indalonis]
MARWAPGARERLQQAAMELFAEHGYEPTTVSQIAGRAGVTDRTFFRHFTDKREVLFAGGEELVAHVVGAVAACPAGDPLAAVAEGLRAAAAYFPDERRPFSRRRQELVEANPALAEREQLKLAGLAGAVGAALRERGVAEPSASLLAHCTTTVFQVSFATWIRDGEERSLQQVQREVFESLRRTLGAPVPPRPQDGATGLGAAGLAVTGRRTCR